MNKKFLLLACLTAFSASAFADGCPTAGFDGFSVGLSAGYRIQTAKDKKMTPEAKATYSRSYVEKTAAEAKEAAVAEAASLEDAYIKDLELITYGVAPNNERVTFVVGETVAGVAGVNIVAGNGLDISPDVKTGISDKLSKLKELTGLVMTDGSAKIGDEAFANKTFTLEAYKLGDFEYIKAVAGGSVGGADAGAVWDNVPGAVYDAFTLVGLTEYVGKGTFADVPGKTLPDGTSTLAAAQSEVSSHNQQGAFRLNVGYGYSFNKFHMGAELFGEMFAGKLNVKKAASDAAKVSSKVLGGTTYSYDKAVADLSSNESISLKNKWSFGLTLKPGLTYGNVLFYVPLEVNMTRYDVKFDRNAENIKGYEGVATSFVTKENIEGVERNVTNVLKTVSVDGADAVNNDEVFYKKQKTRFGYAFGLGAALKLSDSISVDFRGTYSPNSKLKISTPAYKSAALLDGSRLGEKHEIKLSNIKLSLGFTWHFN